MGIINAYAASRSGLQAATKWSEITASNIANANREGYVRKTLTTANSVNGGVQITGVRREVDSALDRMQRLEVSRSARQQAVSGGLEIYTAKLGKPGDAQSIPSRLSTLYSSFSLLTNSPPDPSLQRNVLESARDLVGVINQASRALYDSDQATIVSIDNDLLVLNDGLSEISALNQQILLENGETSRRAVLEDSRSTRMDALSELVDLKITLDGQGRMQVFTAGGTNLVDGSDAVTLTYDRITGKLSAGLVDITPNITGVRGFKEGSLAGRISLRQEVLPQMQFQLDEVSRALMQGFEGVDASLTSGQAGLFTDGGLAFDPSQITGLAGRLSINGLADPAQGGALWRLRDGLGATTAGAASDSSQILDFLSVFETNQSFDVAAGLGANAALTDFVAALVADQQGVRVRAEARGEVLAAGAATIQSARLGVQGVNLDDELQQLLIIEQSYAANAQVMTTLTRMIDTLLAAF